MEQPQLTESLFVLNAKSSSCLMCFNFLFFSFDYPTWAIFGMLVFWLFFLFLFILFLFFDFIFFSLVYLSRIQAVCLWMWAFRRVISARINLLSTSRSCVATRGTFGGLCAPCCCFLMNTHKVANEAAEWEDAEVWHTNMNAYMYIGIHMYVHTYIKPDGDIGGVFQAL